jgi:parallel beta-helix repeat protein
LEELVLKEIFHGLILIGIQQKNPIKLECEMKKLLVLGLIILLIGISLPTTGIEVDKSSIISFNGKTLYVGGSGSGNYTSIQAAINDANNGDTVFVFDDSSPYNEWNIQVNKSINLIGEDKNTTVINAHQHDHVLEIYTDRVNISRFSIYNSKLGGIYVDHNSSNLIISDNHFINCYYGIFLLINDHVGFYDAYIISNSFRNISKNAIFIFSFYRGVENITISDNIIISTSNIILDWFFGDITFMGKNCKIINNTLLRRKSNNFRDGLYIIGGRNNIIKGNKFYGYNQCRALSLESSYNNIISYNNFTNNGVGILFFLSSDHNKIINNNFINNKYDTSSGRFSFINHWDGNYWDEWIGHKFKLPIFQKFPKIIRVGILTFAIDWHPAKEPYEIGV